MKRIIILLMIALILISSGGCRRESVLVEIEPRTIPLSKIYVTVMEISFTNLTDKEIFIPDFVPDYYFHDGRNWVKQPQGARYLLPFPKTIEPGETVIGYFSFPVISVNNHRYKFNRGKYKLEYKGFYGDYESRGVWSVVFRVT